MWCIDRFILRIENQRSQIHQCTKRQRDRPNPQKFEKAYHTACKGALY